MDQMIKSIVADVLNISLDTRSRKKEIKAAIQIMAWFYYHYTMLKPKQIGVELNKTHPYHRTTILHSIKRIDELISVNDKTTVTLVNNITRIIKKYYEQNRTRNN